MLKKYSRHNIAQLGDPLNPRMARHCGNDQPFDLKISRGLLTESLTGSLGGPA